MSHVTTVEVDGAAVPMAARSPIPSRLSLRLRGISTLTLSLTGYRLGQPDPYLGKPIVLKVDGEAVFAGDVVDRPVDYGAKGWGALYQCRDLRARGDKLPFTDSNSLMDSADYNNPEAADKIDARLGRTVGQIVADVLQMPTNAEPLHGRGVGGYTVAGPVYTLHDDTLADLAAMDAVPPRPVSVGGDKLLSAVEAFASAWSPNHALWVRPDGVIRFIDLRTPSEFTLTFGDCAQRVRPSGLSRSLSGRYQRVLVRGGEVATPRMLSLTDGTLSERFAWGDYDNGEAKANWSIEQFRLDSQARSQGSCVVADLTHATLTSDPSTQTWEADEWDQAHRKGRLYLMKDGGLGLTSFDSARVVANAAKASGGASSFTLETPVASTVFDRYLLYGISSGASLVWRKYQAVDPLIRAALAKRFTYPVPYINAGGSSVSLVGVPQATVCYDPPMATGPPYLEFFDPVVDIDLSDGTFLLGTPTWEYSNAPPEDVRILAAVNTQTLTAVAPASGYDGDSHDVEGLEDTLVVTMQSWRDPVNQASVEAYAQDLLDSVKDAVVEGSVAIDTLIPELLTFGRGVSLTGAGYTTGWEGLNAPVQEVDVTWNSGYASHWSMSVGVSNRRAGPNAGAFLLPERQAATVPTAGGIGGFGVAPAVAPLLPDPGGHGQSQPQSQGGYGDDGGRGSPPQPSPVDDVAAMLNQDWSDPDGNTSGKYDGPKPGRKSRPVRRSKPYETPDRPAWKRKPTAVRRSVAEDRAKVKAFDAVRPPAVPRPEYDAAQPARQAAYQGRMDANRATHDADEARGKEIAGQQVSRAPSAGRDMVDRAAGNQAASHAATAAYRPPERAQEDPSAVAARDQRAEANRSKQEADADRGREIAEKQAEAERKRRADREARFKGRV